MQAPPPPPAPPLPATAPWWAWLLLALAGLLVPAGVQILLDRRKRASLARISKDVHAHGATLTEHGATLAALRQRAEDGPEKTDPAIVQAREAQRQGLEQRVQKLEARAERTEGEVRDLKRRAEEDARSDRELDRELGRIAGLLEAQHGGSGSRSRRG